MAIIPMPIFINSNSHITLIQLGWSLIIVTVFVLLYFLYIEFLDLFGISNDLFLLFMFLLPFLLIGIVIVIFN